MSTEVTIEQVGISTHWPTGLDPQPYAAAIDRAKTDQGYLEAMAEAMAEAMEEANDETTQSEVIPVLTALGFTAGRLNALSRRVEDVELTDVSSASLDRSWFTFSCPACRKKVSMGGGEGFPSETFPLNPFGYVFLEHDDPDHDRKCRLWPNSDQVDSPAFEFQIELSRQVGLARPGVDLEWVRLRRQLAGEDVKWLIPGFMEKGTLAALFGPPGTGKSLLALEWAATLAKKGCRVVYLDEENSTELMDERLEAMGMDPASLSRLAYYSFPGWTVDTEDGAALIVEACKNAHLVIFDSWAKFFASASQNDDAAANRAYRLAVKPLRAAGVGILRLDHTNHEEVTRPSGTVAKLADVDHNWQIRAKALGDLRAEVTLVHRKSRTGRGANTINLIREVVPTLTHVNARDRPTTQEDTAEPVEKVAALVAFMDERGWPVDWPVATVQEELRTAGRSARKADVADAVRVRRQAAPVAA